MKKLLIFSVLLMALMVYAVPTESDVGAGYNIVAEEDGGVGVLASMQIICLESFDESGGASSALIPAAFALFVSAGYLQEPAAPPNRQTVAALLFEPSKIGHQQPRKVVMRC